jgi:Beta-propeller repeat
MASGSAVRGVCAVLVAAVGVTLIISVMAADDPVVSPQAGAGDPADAASGAASGGGRMLWSRQPGTSDVDEVRGVATDEDGNIYVVGTTLGALGGRNKGGGDAWVTKFAGDGRRLWSRQPGTSDVDFAQDVATDTDGNVYVVGTTLGALGRRNKGGSDAWVIKFDSDGRRLWSRQPGTTDEDEALGVATDTDGNVYVVGSTFGALGGPFKGVQDAWVIKFDGNGRRLWGRQPGTSNGDSATGVATDTDGNVYVVGTTFGALGGSNKGITDAWVIKFDGDGHQLWSQQPGTSDGDGAFGVATDTDGNVYVVGESDGALGGPSKGEVDAWVIKFDGNGRQLWSQQPGTSAADLARGVATHKDGNVYVVGQSLGALGGPSMGGVDAWVIKFAGDGHPLWSRQPGTSDFDLANGVATDPDGNVSVVGGSYGALGGGANEGIEDAWVIKYAR